MINDELNVMAAREEVLYDLSLKVAEAAGTVRPRWVIGPANAIACDTDDGFHDFHSKKHAQHYLEKKRAMYPNSSLWLCYEVWDAKNFPRYAGDMNAAEKLANEMAAAFALYINNISGGRWVCTGGPLGADTDLAGDTLAEAISKAYLVFKRKLR